MAGNDIIEPDLSANSDSPGRQRKPASVSLVLPPICYLSPPTGIVPPVATPHLLGGGKDRIQIKSINNNKIWPLDGAYCTEGWYIRLHIPRMDFSSINLSNRCLGLRVPSSCDKEFHRCQIKKYFIRSNTTAAVPF